MFDGKAFGEDIVATVKAYVGRTLQPILDRLVALEDCLKGAPTETQICAIVAKAVADHKSIIEIPSSLTVQMHELVKQLVAEAVAALPQPKNGKDADPEQIKAAVAAAVAKLPEPEKGEDGKSVTVEDIRPLVDDLVAQAVAKIPASKDGVGLAGAMIDRENQLVVTLSNGEHKNLGRVVGKDGDNGAAGLGFDDLDLIEDERGVTLRFQRGTEIKEFPLPVVVDRGVWAQRAYRKGSGVTWAGSFWIAQRDTDAKPDSADSGWRLAVKRGRDGKDWKPGEGK